MEGSPGLYNIRKNGSLSGVNGEKIGSMRANDEERDDSSHRGGARSVF